MAFNMAPNIISTPSTNRAANWVVNWVVSRVANWVTNIPCPLYSFPYSTINYSIYSLPFLPSLPSTSIPSSPSTRSNTTLIAAIYYNIKTPCVLFLRLRFL